MPTVSVIVPTYNRADVLGRAIESVLQQTFEDFELIVVDDGSTDSTKGLVESYTDSRINYIRQENSGANAARNRGIDEASGAVVAFLDSDDVLLPRYLRVTSETLLEGDDNIGGVFTAFKRYRRGKLDYIWTVRDGLVEFDDIREGNVIGGFSGTMFKSEVFDSVGGLDERLASSQDYDFYIRVLKEYSMVGIPTVMVESYKRSDSISEDATKRVQGNERIIEKHGEYLAPSRIAAQLSAEGIAYAENGQMAVARERFRQALGENFSFKDMYLFVTSFFGASIFGKSLTLARLARRYRTAYTIK